MTVRMTLLGIWLLRLATAPCGKLAGLPPQAQVADDLQLFELSDPALLDPPGRPSVPTKQVSVSSKPCVRVVWTSGSSM